MAPPGATGRRGGRAGPRRAGAAGAAAAAAGSCAALVGAGRASARQRARPAPRRSAPRAPSSAVSMTAISALFGTVVALLDEDLAQDALERRRHLGVDLVGDDLDAAARTCRHGRPAASATSRSSPRRRSRRAGASSPWPRSQVLRWGPAIGGRPSLRLVSPIRGPFGSSPARRAVGTAQPRMGSGIIRGWSR